MNLIFKQIVLAIILLISNFSLAWSETANERNHVQVFKQGKANVDILRGLKGLTFENDNSKGQSIGEVIAYINSNRDFLIPEYKELNLVNKLVFSPQLITGDNDKELQTFGRITEDKVSAAIRLQQAVYFYLNKQDGNRKKVYVPFEGAEIVAYVKDQQLYSLNSSIIDPVDSKLAATIAQNAKIEDLKNSSLEDRALLFRALNSHSSLEGTTVTQLRSLPESSSQTDILKSFTNNSNILFDIFSKIKEANPDKIKLVYTQQTPSSAHELAWKVSYPFGFPVNLYISANKDKSIRFIKSTPLLENVKVSIYKGNVSKLQKKRKARGDSKELSQRTVQADDKTNKVILINLSKVVEYNRNTFGWNSYNNRGSELKATADLQDKDLIENAAWVSSPYNQFIFGAGGDTLGNFASALDVIGHEFCHSMVDNTAKLQSENQAGALNEHICDILGAGFEADTKGTEYDFKIGEGVIKKNQASGIFSVALRNFLNPESSLSDQPTHMDQAESKFGPFCIASSTNNKCGVHYQAGIPNYAIGKSIEQLGWPKVRPLIFNVLSKRLRSNSDFNDYRKQVEAECNITANFSQEDCSVFSKFFDEIGITNGSSGAGNGSIRDPIFNPIPSSIRPEDSQADPALCRMLKDACVMLKELGSLTEECTKCGL